MDVKQAVRLAKDYVGEVYDGEQISNVGLEEVEFNPVSHQWKITVGFSRLWDRENPTPIPISTIRRPRSYKVVVIGDSNGQVLSMKDRLMERSL